MRTASFAKYLWHIINSHKQPKTVGKTITREYLLNSLGKLGRDRSDLSLLSDDELSELWNNLPGPKDYNPQPTPYVITTCYAYFTWGITDYYAVKFQATLTAFQGFDKNNRIVYTPEPIFYKGMYIDYVRPMYVIGLADEVIRPYISRFHWDWENTIIEFNLKEEQIREFQEIINQLRDEIKVE